eukprot:5562485-Prymnesium_polylepis.1
MIGMKERRSEPPESRVPTRGCAVCGPGRPRTEVPRLFAAFAICDCRFKQGELLARSQVVEGGQRPKLES